jgi:outer membrane protein
MNVRIKIFTVTIGLFLALSRSYADDAPTNSLTLQQARENAIKNHPRITQAELIALASKQVIRENRSAFLPIITGDATAVGTSTGNTRIAAGGLNNPLIYDREAEGVDVSELITDFGRTANLTSSAKLEAKAQEENTLATRAQILLEVDSAFYNALQAQSVLDVARQTVATRQFTFNQVDELAKNKIRSGLDLSFAKVDLDSSKLLLANANNDLQSAYATLANVLGERDLVAYRLVEEPAPTNTVLTDDELVQTALRDRPDLIQLRYGRDAAGKFADAEKDLHYPTVSAFGAAGVLPIHDSAMRDDYAAAGLNLSVPIFDGFLFSAREKEAQLRARAAEETLRDAENNVIRDVRVAAINVTYASQNLTLTAQLLASANESFDLAQARYKAGSSSIVELSQAQLSQTQAQIAETKAKYDYQTRISILNYQLGHLR